MFAVIHRSTLHKATMIIYNGLCFEITSLKKKNEEVVEMEVKKSGLENMEDYTTVVDEKEYSLLDCKSL